MRALLGLLVLGGIFVLAATWQDRRTAELRRQRAHRFGIPDAEAQVDDGWSTLVLGNPSGAEPLAPLEAAPPEDTPDPDTWDPPAYQPDYRYVVAKNDVLGVICQRHYDSARKELVDAIAAYNELKNANDIGEGQVLLLPDEELLDLGD
ncbi:MAG: LysM peptidoglycan-binding domain-containing protein [bacterium]|nr:LysM peptidoglycan-binding domain-containing protein [bacterium]